MEQEREPEQKRAHPDDIPAAPEGGEESSTGAPASYEAMRQARIARNRVLLESLGVSTTLQEPSDSPAASPSTSPRRHYHRRVPRDSERSAVCASLRSSGAGLGTVSPAPDAAAEPARAGLLLSSLRGVEPEPARLREPDFARDATYEAGNYPVAPPGCVPLSRARTVSVLQRVVQHRITDPESDTEKDKNEQEEDDRMVVYPEDDEEEAGLLPDAAFLLSAQTPFAPDGTLLKRRGRPPRVRPAASADALAFDAGHLQYVLSSMRVPAGRAAWVFPATEAVECAAWLPRINTCVAAAGGSAGSVALWNVPARRRFVFAAHHGAVVGVSLARDAEWLLSSSTDGTLRALDLVTGISHPVLVLSSSSSSTTTISTEGDENNEENNNTFSCHTVVSEYDGRVVLCGTEDGKVLLADCRVPGSAVHTAALHTAAVNNIAMHPCHTEAFLTASDDGYCALWDLRQTSTRTSTSRQGSLWWRASPAAVLSASLSPHTPTLLLVSTADCVLRLFDTAAWPSGRETLLHEWTFPVPPYAPATPPLRRYVAAQKHRLAAQWDPFRPCVAFLCNRRTAIRPVGMCATPDRARITFFDSSTRQHPFSCTPTVCAVHPLLPNVIVAGDAVGNILTWVSRYSLV